MIPRLLVLLLVSTLVTGPLSAANPEDSSKRAGLEAARASLKEMKAAPGLEVSLFAAEPMIQNPTNIEIDHRGRVWAVEAVNYRSSFQKWGWLRPLGDRVVILEDTDHDGAADKELTFFQDPKLTNPLGICLLPGPGGEKKGTQVLVSAAPNLWLLTDQDGDDKADQADILLKVGGNWDHDHQIHAFVFGPEGKLYFNFGNESQKLMRQDGTTVKDLAGNEIAANGKPYRQGMVFRCDLVGGALENFETLGWNFRNNYEVCVDSFGTLWQSDNDDDGNKGVRINYVMEGGNFGFTDEMTGAGWSTPRTNLETEIPLRHWHLNDPGVVPNLLQTGAGSPTGILINEGAALGPQFTNQLIHCDAGPRIVRAYPVVKDGAGYKAEMADLLSSTDNWYRPSDVALAPDGALFVADWYDPGVGGHNMQDREAETIRGRIYRVAAPGAKATVPKHDFSTAAGAVAALQSPNKVTQTVAWRALRALGAEAEPELLQLWKNENPRLRGRALGLLVQIKSREIAHLKAGLADADPDLRVAAVRLTKMSSSRQLDTAPVEEDRELMRKLLRDPSPEVRRQIALALADASGIAGIWAALARQHDGKDRWYLEALGIGARGNEEECFDAWLKAVGDDWNTPAGRDIIWRMRSPKAAALLGQLLQDKAIPDAEKPRYLRAFDFLSDSPERNKALLALAALGKESETIALEALQRLGKTKIANSPEVTAAVERLLADAKGTPRFVELVRDFKIKGQGAGLLAVATKDPSHSIASEALKLALAEGDASKLVSDALATPGSSAVINLLGATTDRGSQKILLELIRDSQRDAGLRNAALLALARTQQGVEALLRLARESKFPEELRATASAALHTVQLPKFKDEIAQLFPAPNALRGTPLPPVMELAKLQGDASRGQAITERVETTCVTCHRIREVGADFAPALTEIGSKLGKDALYDAIINPNAGISMGFETWQLDLKNGASAMGIIRSETKEEVVLALPMGITNKVPKSQITKREKLAHSMMPSGLNQVLSQQDLVDMVEYLAGLKKP